MLKSMNLNLEALTELARSLYRSLLSMYNFELGVTHNTVTILSAAQQCFYGEFMSPAILNLNRTSCEVSDTFVDLTTSGVSRLFYNYPQDRISLKSIQCGRY